MTRYSGFALTLLRHLADPVIDKRLLKRPVTVIKIKSALSTKTQHERKKIKIPRDSPSGGSSDMIGPPDPTSNIRPVNYYIPPNETTTEQNFRLRRQEVLEWTHKFWSDHNTQYFKEKEKFIQSHQSQGDDDTKKSLSPEELSVFYRAFLNEKRAAHLHFNKEWYKKNISLLWPAFKVNLIWLRRKWFQKS